MIPEYKSPYPDQRQLLLLRAALSEADVAKEAWAEWSADWDVEGYLDNGSFRLLPLVYRNIVMMLSDDLRLHALEGVYKSSLDKNKLLFAKTKALLPGFQNRNIPVLLLKGAALSMLYYQDSGARPMADIDILIPEKKAEEGVALLRSMGFRPEREDYLEYNLVYGRSMMFHNEEGFELDLHWRPFFEYNRSNRPREEIWDSKVVFDFFGMKAYTTDSVFHLLHTIVHGVQWNPEPPIRWIADAVKILRAGLDDADWKRFLQLTRACQTTLVVHEALRFLSSNFTVSVPDHVLHALQHTPVSIAEKLIFRYDKKPPDKVSKSLPSKLHTLFIVYLRQTPVQGFFRQMLAFSSYLLFRTRGKSRVRLLSQYFREDERKGA